MTSAPLTVTPNHPAHSCLEITRNHPAPRVLSLQETVASLQESLEKDTKEHILSHHKAMGVIDHQLKERPLDEERQEYLKVAHLAHDISMRAYKNNNADTHKLAHSLHDACLEHPGCLPYEHDQHVLSQRNHSNAVRSLRSSAK